MVIYVIITRDGMRTKTNVMLFNLALADVLFLLSCPHYTAYRAAHATLHLGSSAFDQVLCKSVTCILYVTAYVTIYTLVLIAVVRYVGIVCFKLSRFITRTTLVLSSCGLWITMCAANSPIIFAYRMIAFNTTEWCQTDSRRIVDTTFFTFAYFLPLAVIALCSIGIWRHVRRNVMTSQRESRAGQAKAEWLLVAVVAAFAVCWLPMYLMLLVD